MSVHGNQLKKDHFQPLNVSSVSTCEYFSIKVPIERVKIEKEKLYKKGLQLVTTPHIQPYIERAPPVHIRVKSVLNLFSKNSSIDGMKIIFLTPFLESRV